jgi:hypothetical protein
MPSFGFVQIRASPIGGVRVPFVVACFFAKRILILAILAGRKLVGPGRIKTSEAAVFVGVGHWLHDTSDFFSSDNAWFLFPFLCPLSDRFSQSAETDLFPKLFAVDPVIRR